MALVPHSAKIRADQKSKLQQLAEKYECSVNAVLIRLIDKAKVK